MAPPPNLGDATNNNEEDPLGGMDPMAWLESLAKRQGANTDELTTAANIDVPELPPDTVVDEPGYTPGYDTGKSAAATPAKAAQPATPPPPPPPAPTPEPVASVASGDDPLGGMDPMAWLESLAKRQGANTDELTTTADIDIPVLPSDTVVDEPGYTPGYDTGKSAAAAPVKAEQPAAPPPPPPPAPTPEPVASTVSEETMIADPMAWLESLAKRQGANTDELTTTANIDIPELPPDTVVDEPGYTPGYDTGKSAAAAPVKAEQPAAPPPPPPPAPTPEPVASVASGDDPLGGMDPMAWLESLAARQGASLDELTTAHDLDIPEPPPGTIVDEPGYVPYDPFGGTGVSREPAKAAQPPSAPPEPEPAMATSDDPLGGMDALSWLEQLASQQDSEVLSFTDDFVTADSADAISLDDEAMPDITTAETSTDVLGGMDPMTWLENLASGQGPELDEIMTNSASTSASPSNETEYSPFAATGQPAEAAMQPESALSWLEDLAKGQGEGLPDFAAPAEEAERVPVDEAGGMSNDINEVQAWLEAQARNLEQTRVELESSEGSGDLAPAEPASELPDWLQAAQPQEGDQKATTPALSNEIATPIAPEDLPSWLLSPSEEPALDIAEDLVEAIRATGTMKAVPPVEEPALSSAELHALTRPESPDAVDSWAEALDEEYERKVAGDESVPDWYQEALERAESQLPQAELPSSTHAAPPPPAPEPEVAPAVAEVPDWLQQMSPVEQPPEPLAGEVPDWLRTMAPSEQAAPVPAAAESEDWLQGEVEVDDFPTWLRPEPETPAAPPVQAPVQQTPVAPPPPPPAPQPQPVVQQAAPPPPPPPRPAPQAPRVAIPTGPAGPEHHARLKQARDLVAQNQSAASLEHYQALIDSSQLLEETRGDLRQLVDTNPTEPKLRRLLGDTHMRLGDLQAALDTYRSALDQL